VFPNTTGTKLDRANTAKNIIIKISLNFKKKLEAAYTKDNNWLKLLEIL